jgi:hypothetical protein
MTEKRPYRIVARNEPGPAFGPLGLGHADWKSIFDVFELDRNQLAILYDVLEEISEHCGAWIDLYEEGEVNPDKLDAMLACIGRARASLADEAFEPGDEAVVLLEKLEALTLGAKARGVSVWFLL